MKLFSWFNERRRSILLFNITILLIITTPFVVYNSIATHMNIIYDIVDITNTDMVNLLINITITVIILLLFLRYLTSVSWSVRYKLITPIENGVIDKNLDNMTVETLIGRLEEYSSESLVLLKDNHIIVISKDSIKLKEG